MNLEKVINFTEMLLSVSKDIEEVTNSNYDLRGLSLRLNAFISIGDNLHLRLTKSEAEQYYKDNEGKTDLADAWSFYQSNRQGIDAAFDAKPETVIELISRTDVAVRKSIEQLNRVADGIKKIDGDKSNVFFIISILRGKLNSFLELFIAYLGDSDPRLEKIEGCFCDKSKAVTFLVTIDKNPQKDRVIGMYKQKSLIKVGKYEALLRICEQLGIIKSSAATKKRVQRNY